MKHRNAAFSVVGKLGVSLFALTLATPALFAQLKNSPADIAGPAQVGHQVADLDRSVKWFKASGFTLMEGPSPWTVDKELNQLGNTPGAESRTATMTVRSAGSDAAFRLVLREYRGVTRQDWSKSSKVTGYQGRPSTGEGALLNALGLMQPRQETVRVAVLEDPDGLVFGAAGLPLEVNDFAAGNPQAAKFQDINANYRAFQVENLETVYAQAKQNGAITVTDGGIVNYNKGRAVVVRDPGTGGYILLWQSAS